jgi:hypothetical protein
MTGQDDHSALDALGLLDDYVSGAMPGAESEAFELALFERAARGEAPEAEFVERLRRASEWIARRGAFNVGSTRAEVDALRNAGVRMSYLEFGRGGIVEVPALPPDIDLFVYHLDVDLRGSDAVDVLVETPSGEPLKTFRDVRYDPTDGSIYGVCEVPLAEISFRRGTVVSKVVARQGGERRLVATFETRPLPAAET